MEILPITREYLYKMHDILIESAGYSVNIKDEIHYFDLHKDKGSWLTVTQDTNFIAFVRYFKQNSFWSLGEIYVKPEIKNRTQVATALLKKFKKSLTLPKEHRLRFDVLCLDKTINMVLKTAGFSEKIQTFKHYEFQDNGTDHELEADPVKPSEAQQVVDVLSNLHTVSITEVNKWIENKSILATRFNNCIVSSAQIYNSGEALEINRFATHRLYLRKGFARILMALIFNEMKKRRKKYIFLKVDSSLYPAISFYKNIGFIEKNKKHEYWHSSIC